MKKSSVYEHSQVATFVDINQNALKLGPFNNMLGLDSIV